MNPDSEGVGRVSADAQISGVYSLVKTPNNTAIRMEPEAFTSLLTGSTKVDHNLHRDSPTMHCRYRLCADSLDRILHWDGPVLLPLYVGWRINKHRQ